MIFDNEHTNRGTERIKHQYCENGKAARKAAIKDMSKCGFNSGCQDLLNSQSLYLKAFMNNNIIYIH